MYLPGRHGIYLPGTNREMYKIDRVPPATAREIHQVIERMPVREMKIAVCVQVVCKTIHHDLCMSPRLG